MQDIVPRSSAGANAGCGWEAYLAAARAAQAPNALSERAAITSKVQKTDDAIRHN